MVTTEIEKLRRQIKIEQSKISEKKEQQKLQQEKDSLQDQLKVLQRSTSTKRNIVFAQRTGRGFKRIAKAVGGALVRQARLIKEQQLREDAAFRKAGKKIVKTAKKTRKKLSKAAKRRGKKISKKTTGQRITFQLG